MTAFCDWLSCRLPVEPGRDIDDGYLKRVRVDGEIEYMSRMRLAVEGSYSDKVLVRASAGSGFIELSGNPTKFLQGHNVFGCADPRLLALGWAFQVLRRLEIQGTGAEWQKMLHGEIDLTRIDVTRMYRFSPGGVPGWLGVAGEAIHRGRQGVTMKGTTFTGGTVYVGQHSKRISLKMYDKAAELKVHPPKYLGVVPGLERVMEWAQDSLRVEVVLRSKELTERGMRSLAKWSLGACDSLLDERLGLVTMMDNVCLAEVDVAELPRRLLGPYSSWKEGHDLRQVYKKSQFYAYRRDLLAFGIDISRVRPRVIQAERVYPLGRPLRSFLCEPLSAPDWAIGTPLLVG